MKKVRRYRPRAVNTEEFRMCFSEDVAELEEEYAELEAINAQMLEALEKIAALDYTMGGINCFCWRAHTIADAAIAKAEGKEQP